MTKHVKQRAHGEQPWGCWDGLGEKPCSQCSLQTFRPALDTPKLASSGFVEILIIPPSRLRHVRLQVPARDTAFTTLHTTNPLGAVTRMLHQVSVLTANNTMPRRDELALPAARPMTLDSLTPISKQHRRERLRTLQQSSTNAGYGRRNQDLSCFGDRRDCPGETPWRQHHTGRHRLRTPRPANDIGCGRMHMFAASLL